MQVARFRDNGQNLQGFIGTKSTSDNYSKVEHVSYQIEEQENILRQYILGSNMTKDMKQSEKDK
jgi:hypothetical protein